LVGATVIDVGRLGVARRGEPTLHTAGCGVAGTAVLACGVRSTLALGRRAEAVGIHGTTAHVGAGGDELAVEGEADPPFGRVVGEGRVVGQQAVSQ